MIQAGRLVLCSYGSGNPDQLPVRTVNMLTEATMALFPDTTPSAVSSLIAPGARRIVLPLSNPFLPGERTWSDVREEVNGGGTVVRLYPESPQIDAVALNEARTLARDGLDFETIPEPSIGLTAASYAGVPLDLGRGTVTFVGEQAVTALNPMVTGTAIASIGRLERANEAAARLLRSGWSSTTPCVWVQRPGLAMQETHDSSLGELSQRSALPSGGVLIAGDAVRQRSTYAWFERLPLLGKRVLVTRTAAQAATFSSHLRVLGAEPIEFPAIGIAPPASFEALDEAIARLSDYTWVIFTSVNAVDAFFARLETSGKDARAFGGVSLAAIGTATAERLRQYGLRADFVPERFVAEEALAGLLERGAGSGRVLLPRAEQARDVLPDGLREAGAEVDVVPVYRTIQGTPSPDALAQVRNGSIDIVTLTSSSTARNLATMLGGQIDALRQALVACISPVTAATARKVGFRVDVIATDFSVPGLIAAIVAATERSLS
jgi:uroporphyrinogen-III synthase/siroheme synthase